MLWQALPGGSRLEEGGEGDVQVSELQFWPAVARLGHLSIQEGPIGALITQAPVAPSDVRMARRGATPYAQSVPLTPGLCLSVTAPIGKTPNMNYNTHNNNLVDAGRVLVMAHYESLLGKHQFKKRLWDVK